MLHSDSIVIVHLNNPTEKFWGVLKGLDATGLAIRAISVSSFDEWVFQVARNEHQALGLSTMFVPLFRVERIFLDEQVGEVESYRQRFEQRTGVTVESYLGLDDTTTTEVPS